MNTLRLAWDRTILELKMYARERDMVIFSFLFPVIMLAIFRVVFGSEIDAGEKAQGMNAARVFLPGMIAAGVLLTSFQTLAMSVAIERDDGTLKRLRGTPLPPVAYFLGKVGLVLITALAQLALLLVVARFVLDVRMPTEPAAWLHFAAFFVVGVVGGTTLGVAYSSLANPRSVTAVVVGPLLVLQFISGVYFTFGALPSWLQQIAAVFPLKWIAQGMRSVFYPASWAGQEMTGTWEVGRTLLVLAVWAVSGLVLCLRTFRWTRDS